MKFIRGEDGRLVPVGVVDLLPTPPKRQSMMKSLSARRKKITTPAEKKLAFHLQSMIWHLGGIVHFQRERTVHLADILSRSLDFYFSACKVGIEVDGKSHDDEIQKAKDEWTDRLMIDHDRILVLRFTNENVFNNVAAVIKDIADTLLSRHSWPNKLRLRFEAVIEMADNQDSWQRATGKYLDGRRRH